MKLPACVGLVILAGSFSVIYLLFPTSAVGADVPPGQEKILLSRLKESAKIYKISGEGTDKNLVKVKELSALKKSRENHDTVIAEYSSQPIFCDLILLLKVKIDALCLLLPPNAWLPIPILGLPLAIANLKSCLALLLADIVDQNGNCRCSLPNVVISP